MNDRLRAVILGCGSSGGVPRADGDWGACDPADARNRRTRCSLLVQRAPAGADWTGEGATSVLIDTAPDLRAQLLAAGVRRLDAVVYSHDHADQCHGIDDLRPLVYRARRRLPAYMDAPTAASLRRRFAYIFDTDPATGYPALLDAAALPAHGADWAIDGPGGPVPLRTYPQRHGAITSLGFRFGPIGYSNDVNAMDDWVLEAFEGVEVWIVDALRWTPHPSHAHVDQALAWIARVKPRRAILTNLHVDLDYAALAARLPQGVEPAIDGLAVEAAL